MYKDRGFRVLAIIAIIIAVAGLSVGYSALSQQLKINSNTTVKGGSNVWDIKIENIQEVVLTGSAKQVAAPTATSTSVDFKVSVLKPGDTATYKFDVKNAGQIDAKLASDVAITGLEDAADKNITYTIKYADGTNIVADDTLPINTTRTIELKIVYNESATTVPSEDLSLDVNATLLYVQK